MDNADSTTVNEYQRGFQDGVKAAIQTVEHLHSHSRHRGEYGAGRQSALFAAEQALFALLNKDVRL